MMDKVELSRIPSRFIPPPGGWDYPTLKAKYYELSLGYESMMEMSDNSLRHAASLQQQNDNLAADLENALECYRRLHLAQRHLDGEYTPPTFDEMNPEVVPTSRLSDEEVH